MREVRFFTLDTGDHFTYKDQEYVKVYFFDNFACALNLVTYRITYFTPTQAGVFSDSGDPRDPLDPS